MKYTLKQKFEIYTQPFVIEPDGFNSIRFLCNTAADDTVSINGINLSLFRLSGIRAIFDFKPYVENKTTYIVNGLSSFFPPVYVIKDYYTKISNP